MARASREADGRQGQQSLAASPCVSGVSDPGRFALCLCRRANARPRLDAQAALEPGKDTAAYPRGAATLPLAVQWVCGRAPRVPRSRAGREARTLSCPGGPQSQCGVCAAIHPLILRLCPRRAVSLTTSLMRRGKGGDQGKDAATARQTVGGARCGN